MVNDWKARGRPQYIDSITSAGDEGGGSGLDGNEELDPLFDQAVAFVIDKRRASISGVQRQFCIGYNRAVRIVEQMELQGIVSSPGHNGNREVLSPAVTGVGLTPERAQRCVNRGVSEDIPSGVPSVFRLNKVNAVAAPLERERADLYSLQGMSMMKKRLMTACQFAAVLATSAFADDADVLQSRLNQVNSFHANFTQRVTGAEGGAVQEGEGELWVKRPNLFNWHMTAPDESVLVSDGKTLWFYNPFVEQVTANWLKNTTDNTPFMLITRNSTADWRQYNVKQQGDSFSLVPKFDNGNMKQFTIKVTANGTIEGFTAVEQDGQRSAYELKSQKNGPVEETKFHFTLPKGVTLDDQRQ